MTAPHPDDLIQAFIAEGRDELPDRAFDVVRSEIHSTRQRIVLGPWREPTVSNFTRIAIAAAAIGVIALAWVNFGTRNAGPGNGPSQTPIASETIAPSTTPGASSSNLTPGLLCSSAGSCRTGNLGPGDYSFDLVKIGSTAPTRATFAVPAGWSATSDWYVLKHAGAADELMFTVWDVTHVYPDVCHRDDSALISAGTTTAELATLLTAQNGRVASATTDVSVGGFPAKRLELTTPADLDVGTCTGTVLRPWPDPGPDLSGGYCCFPAGSIDDVSIVDASGYRLVFVARHQPGSSAADQAELRSIVDSIAIEPPSAEPSPGASITP
jgi:hypothetical protein